MELILIHTAALALSACLAIVGGFAFYGALELVGDAAKALKQHLSNPHRHGYTEHKNGAVFEYDGRGNLLAAWPTDDVPF